jgi:thioredoxin 1
MEVYNTHLKNKTMKKPEKKTSVIEKFSENLKSNKMKKVLIVGVLIVAVSIFLYGKSTKSESSEAAISTETTENVEVVLSDATFDKVVLKSDKLVMVDFWATWCGPCRMVAPTVKQIAEEYKGKIVVGKVDVDQCGATANMYRIQSIPTLLFFKNGKVVDQVIGVAPKEMLKQKIDNLLKSK